MPAVHHSKNEVARGNKHVTETNVQAACPVPLNSTCRDAQSEKSQDADTHRTFSQKKNFTWIMFELASYNKF